MRAQFVKACISGALLAAGLASCSLGLDESLMSRGAAGSGTSTGGTSGAGGASGSGGAPATGGTGGAGGPCKDSSDCPANGCYEGECVSNTCVYSRCPTAAACEVRSCNEATNTCGAPSPLGFHSGRIDLGEPFGCAGSPARCVAAFGDYVFAVTDRRLFGWRITDPSHPEPLIIDTPFFGTQITRLVATGGRLLVLGPALNGRLNLAWLEPPSGPTSTRCEVTASAVTFTDGISYGFPGEPGSAFIVWHKSLFPAAYLTPPTANDSTLAMQLSTGLATDANVIGSSGTRLVAFRVDTTDPASYLGYFSLETNAGTVNAQPSPEQAMTGAGDVPNSLPAHVFASGFDGSVVWLTNHVATDEGAGVRYGDGVILRWPLHGHADSFDDGVSVVLETYPPFDPDAADRVGPLALVGAGAVVATTGLPSDPTLGANVYSVVRDDTRDPKLTRGGASFVLPHAARSLGVAGGDRFGFVSTPRTTTPPEAADTAIHIFAPACN